MEHAKPGPVRYLKRTQETPSDQELVYRIRGGDAWAEEILYRRHAPQVLGLAARLLHNEAEAHDVMQDTFILAFERLEQLSEPAALKDWLKSITVRNVHRRFRRRQLVSWFRLAPAEAEGGLRQMAVEEVPPDVAAELALLERVLGHMSSQERMAWMLRHIEGESLASVAKLLDVSLATAKRRIAAAQKLIDRYAKGERL